MQKGIQSVIVPEGSKITSVDDLSADGAKYLIGTQKGTTATSTLRAISVLKEL